MFFDNYKDHPNAKINPSLFWEYNVEQIDFVVMRNIVVQRVVERGWMEDWYAMFNLYGIDGVKTVVLEISYLNEKDLNFVSNLFNLPLSLFKCYVRKQSDDMHWNE